MGEQLFRIFVVYIVLQSAIISHCKRGIDLLLQIFFSSKCNLVGKRKDSIHHYFFNNIEHFCIFRWCLFISKYYMLLQCRVLFLLLSIFF